MLIFPFPFPSLSVTGRALSLLSCPKKWTAYIVTSRDSVLAGGLSIKKQSHTTTFIQILTVFILIVQFFEAL